MPLSDHEQRLLDQIERALYADDPKFADQVRTTDLRRHYRRRLVRASAALVIGVAAVVAGLITVRWYVWAPGLALMLLAAYRGALAVSKLSGRSFDLLARRRQHVTPHSPRQDSGQGRIRARFEERWRRRFDDPDDR